MSETIEITSSLLRRRPLPRLESGDKEQRGRVMVISGSVELPGAALLAGVASLRAGAGKLQIASCRSTATPLAIAIPEARLFAMPETETGAISPDAATLLVDRANACAALVIGPGMVDKDASIRFTSLMLQAVRGPAMVLDADAMAGLTRDPALLQPHDVRVVLTPHPGEMAGMMEVSRDEVEADPLAMAKKAASALNAIVALKGPSTWIAHPSGEALVFRQGTVGLATSGSGDVLAGVIGGLLARGADPLEAAMWGVYLHGMAGRRLQLVQGETGFLARELPAEIPRVMAELA